MKSDIVRQIMLYKYRYIIGFGVLGLFILLAAAWKFWVLPNGLTEAEMAAATSAGHFSVSQIFSNVVDLPWTVTEWISIKIFGATAFAFRLPAVILMILATGGLIMLLRKWARKNIAVISSFLVVTSVLFIGLSRSATPSAMTTFLIVAILLSTLTVIRAVEKLGQGHEKNQVQRNWQTLLAKVVLCVALALLCYQAAGIYLVVAFIAVGMAHPKTRLIFIKSKPWKISIGAVAGLAVVTPLVIGLVFGGSTVVREWLALDGGAWSLEHLGMLGSALVGFKVGFIGGLVTPISTLAGLIIAVLGLIKVGTGILSARSYMVLSFMLAALLLVIWQPTLIYLLFVPLALLTTVGIDGLVRSWYDLFPRNPYARLLPVIPLTILVAGLGWASIARFNLSQNYDVDVVYHYSQEFSAVRDVLGKEEGTVTVVVSSDQQKFYEILRRDFSNVKVATELNKDSSNIVLGSSGVSSKDVPSKVVTNSHSKDSVLLRVYKK